MAEFRPAAAGAAVEGAHRDGEAGQLRGALVDRIVARQALLGRALPGPVEAALRAVPRHVFTPGVSLARAYEDESIITKTSQRGVNISAVSAPAVVAGMLAQLDVRPGHAVLEIGSGGYNAALLRELAGPDGSVTTLDIDPDVTGRARACLDRAGYRDVRTVRADGECGAAGFGPFDRIIVTAGAWDIPPAWTGQLTRDGRIVVPLRTRGLTRSWALDRDGDRLVSRDHMMCGFVPMQGAGEHRSQPVLLHEDGVSLRVDELTEVDGASLAGMLAQPRAEAWTGVTVAKSEPFADLDLWLVTLPDFCQLTATQDAVGRGLVTPSWRMGTPALISGASMAYRARLRPAGGERFEFGAYGHGPHGGELARRLAGQIQVWDRDFRAGPGPVLAVYPAGTPDSDLPDGLVLNKRHTRIVLSWADPAR